MKNKGIFVKFNKELYYIYCEYVYKLEFFTNYCVIKCVFMLNKHTKIKHFVKEGDNIFYFNQQNYEKIHLLNFS